MSLGELFLHSALRLYDVFTQVPSTFTALGFTLGNKVFLKLGQELQVKQVIRSECLLANNCLHGLDVFSDSVASILRTHTNTHMCPTHRYFSLQGGSTNWASAGAKEALHIAVVAWTATTNDLLFSVWMHKENLTHKLVGDIGVVSAGHSLPNGGLHEPRQGGQHVDRGVNLEHRKHKSNYQQLQSPDTSQQPVCWPQAFTLKVQC